MTRMINIRFLTVGIPLIVYDPEMVDFEIKVMPISGMRN